MRTMLLIAVTLLAAAPASGQYAPWWIPGTDCQLECYSETNFEPYTIAGTPALERVRTPYFGTYGGYFAEGYTLDEAGDLYRTIDTWLDPVSSHDVQRTVWDPPLLTLDYPLTAGKTWAASSMIQTNGAGLWRPVSLTGTVVGPRILETDLGPLSVIEVQLDYVSSYGPNGRCVHLLHEQLGDVSELVGLTGCATVPDAKSTWSDLKATYR